jgi:hypothetical protein
MSIKTKSKILSHPVILFILLTSCDGQAGETPQDTDAHSVTLTTDWSRRGRDVDIPPHYTVRTGDLQLRDISEETFTIPHTFRPGSHSIYVYNPADNITIDGNTATVDLEDGKMKSLPGWFFTSSHHITVEEGKGYRLAAVMEQQIRELTFVIATTRDFAGQIASVSASLNGIASQLDIPSGEVAGRPVSVNLYFERSTDSTFVASTRLAGIIGDTQLFTYRMAFKDDMLPALVRFIDLHDGMLKDFNADKATPLTLEFIIIPE